MTPPSDPDPSPAALARRLRQGTTDALDAWYRAEWPTVHRLCAGLLADAGEAEDAAQDAMLKLHDRIDAWDPGRAYDAWRTTVVLNLCRDRLRSRSRRAARERAPELALPDRLPRPDREAERGELRAALAAALACLSPREREVFVLRDLEGVATDDAAERLGVTASSVRATLSLARRRLREKLERRLPAELLPNEGGAA